ncbi:DoxX family protein [Nocardia transvalensis]|nr:DoxX family protein [Nocardia transvalensis]
MDPTPRPRWNAVTRVGFRFCVLYFGLFCLLDPQITFTFTGWVRSLLPAEASLWLVRPLSPLVQWVGRTVFGTEAVLHTDSVSGDQRFHWVLVCCVLVVSLAATLVWSVLDRRRGDYRRLAGWFWLLLRLCLAGQMLYYGVVKAIPTQMPAPSLTTLLQPYGSFTPMGVLWNQVGASRPYEILLGCAELTAGILLLIPRTAVLGLLLSLVSLGQVFVLNMTFDVPVKILSGHLLLICLVLLAPQAGRLLEVLVLERTPGPIALPHPFTTARGRRIGTAAQVVVGVWVLSALVHHGWNTWTQVGGGRDRPPLYGIWTVSQFARDGQEVPPLTTDRTRWRRVVFETPGRLTYQRMDDTMVTAMAQVDTAKHRLDIFALPTAAGTAPHRLGMARLGFTQPGPDRLHLQGVIDGHRVDIALDRIDPATLPLQGTGFHWVQDYQNL